MQNTNRRAAIAVSVSLVAVCGFGAGASAGVVGSAFDADLEGWGTLNDARDLMWRDDVGNPVGSISAVDRGSGSIWYFAASAAYLGDQSGALGGSIGWELLGLVGNQTSISGRADVMLSGGGTVIGISAIEPVNGQWVGASVALSESADWRIVSSMSNGTLSSTEADAADLQTVLASLDGFYIRGEFTNGGGDSVALDNVVLVPAPGALALFAGGGLVLATRRRR